jgi:hypothetical protein
MRFWFAPSYLQFVSNTTRFVMLLIFQHCKLRNIVIFSNKHTEWKAPFFNSKLALGTTYRWWSALSLMLSGGNFFFRTNGGNSSN